MPNKSYFVRFSNNQTRDAFLQKAFDDSILENVHMTIGRFLPGITLKDIDAEHPILQYIKLCVPEVRIADDNSPDPFASA